jgi:hypothetical protein
LELYWPNSSTSGAALVMSSRETALFFVESNEKKKISYHFTGMFFSELSYISSI